MNKDLEPKNIRPLILGNKDSVAHLLEEGLMGDGSIPPEQWHKPDDDRSTQAPSESTVVHDFRPTVERTLSPAEQYKQSMEMKVVELGRITKETVRGLNALSQEIEEAVAMVRANAADLQDAMQDHYNMISELEKFTEITRSNIVEFVRPFKTKG